MYYAAHGALAVSASARSCVAGGEEEEEEERGIEESLASRSRSALRLPNSCTSALARMLARAGELRIAWQVLGWLAVRPAVRIGQIHYGAMGKPSGISSFKSEDPCLSQRATVKAETSLSLACSLVRNGITCAGERGSGLVVPA